MSTGAVHITKKASEKAIRELKLETIGTKAAKLRKIKAAGLGTRQQPPSLEAWTLYDLDRSGRVQVEAKTKLVL